MCMYVSLSRLWMPIRMVVDLYVCMCVCVCVCFSDYLYVFVFMFPIVSVCVCFCFVSLLLWVFVLAFVTYDSGFCWNIPTWPLVNVHTVLSLTPTNGLRMATICVCILLCIRPQRRLAPALQCLWPQVFHQFANQHEMPSPKPARATMQTCTIGNINTNTYR